MIDGLAPHPDQQILEAVERAIDEVWLEAVNARLDRADSLEREAHDLARVAAIVLVICAAAMAAILFQAIRMTS